jgi:hypothetical protein
MDEPFGRLWSRLDSQTNVNLPIEENSNDNDVERSSEDEDGNASNLFDDDAESHRKNCVTYAVSDHHVADIVNAPAARDESLRNS